MNDVFPVPTGANVVNMVQITFLSAHAAFLGSESGIYVILGVIYKIQ